MRSEKLFSIIFILVFLFFFSFNVAWAESTYVLPYPSSMPGSFDYKIRLFWDKLMQYWYFGSLAQFKYNLAQSDKYLVEAKTLFEYKQYLLAYIALEKSNTYFFLTLPVLEQAKKESKDITYKKDVFKQAALKHIEELDLMKKKTPESFIWQPEKSAASSLHIWRLIKKSREIREKIL